MNEYHRIRKYNKYVEDSRQCMRYCLARGSPCMHPQASPKICLRLISASLYGKSAAVGSAAIHSPDVQFHIKKKIISPPQELIDRYEALEQKKQ